MNTKIYKVQLCDGGHNDYYYAASDINAIFENPSQDLLYLKGIVKAQSSILLWLYCLLIINCQVDWYLSLIYVLR